MDIRTEYLEAHNPDWLRDVMAKTSDAIDIRKMSSSYVELDRPPGPPRR
jgi:hypothetical protein